MSNVCIHSNPEPENLKGIQGKKKHAHSRKNSLKLSHTQTYTQEDKPGFHAYFPASQERQALSPASFLPVSLYVPAGQGSGSSHCLYIHKLLTHQFPASTGRKKRNQDI